MLMVTSKLMRKERWVISLYTLQQTQITKEQTVSLNFLQKYLYD